MTPDLISDTYLALNRDLHAAGSYGRKGDKWADTVRDIITTTGAASILDYGCGQGALARALGGTIQEYDPAIDGKNHQPVPADLVVCTDVIEHIEPTLLDNVLDHLVSLTRDALFAVISTRPAKKFLADGRNAHLIVEPAQFWREKMEARLPIVTWETRADEVVALLRRDARD